MNTYLVAGAVIAVAVAGAAGYIQGADHGRAEVQAAWDKEKAKLAEEYAKAQQAAREKEQQLQAQADQLREETNAKTQELAVRAASLADSVRKRPERTAQASTVSSAAGAVCPACSCTGAALPREDAEFLAREAARADELRIALDSCVRQYETLRAR
jgi:DNA repair exonuclease SbcCD ATPase subunit